METIIRSREECLGLLKDMGVTVVASENGGFKCRVDEIAGQQSVFLTILRVGSTGSRTDSSGYNVNKTVRFRVEFDMYLGPSTPTPNAPSSASGFSPLNTPVLDNRRSSFSNDTRSGSRHSYHPPTLERRPTSVMYHSSRGSTFSSAKSVGGRASIGSMCTITFIQERGAYSTLKVVFARVREAWT